MTQSLGPVPSFHSNPAHALSQTATKPKSYDERLVAFLDSSGGRSWNHELQTWVPKDPSQIKKAWTEVKDQIAQQLGEIEPKDSFATGSFTWKNSTETLAQLRHEARKSSNDFKKFISNIASRSASKTFFGPEDAFAAKSLVGAWQKAVNRMKWSSDTIGFLNDSLRGTMRYCQKLCPR